MMQISYLPGASFIVGIPLPTRTVAPALAPALEMDHRHGAERSEVLQKSEEFQGMSLDEMRQALVERARQLGLDRHLAGLLAGPPGAGDDGDGPVN